MKHNTMQAKWLKPLAILLLAVLSFSFPLSAFSQSYREILADSVTMTAGGSPYWAPDGTTTSDTAWFIPISNSTPWYSLSLFVKVDSVTGSDPPTTVTIEGYLGFQNESTAYIGYQYIDKLTFFNDTDSMVYNTTETRNPWKVFNGTFGTVYEADTAYCIKVPDEFRFDKHRWRITVSDTARVTVTEVGRRE